MTKYTATKRFACTARPEPGNAWMQNEWYAAIDAAANRAMTTVGAHGFDLIDSYGAHGHDGAYEISIVFRDKPGPWCRTGLGILTEHLRDLGFEVQKMKLLEKKAS